MVEDEIDDLLLGPTAIAFINGDVVEAAKGLRDFAKANPALDITDIYAFRSSSATTTLVLNVDGHPRTAARTSTYLPVATLPSSTTSPWAVNFTALLSRLSSTCRTRDSSPQ